MAEKNPATAGGITGTYSGNVIITQGDIRMRSDTVRIVVVNNKPQKIFFNGNVVVNSASGTATGDSGIYDVVPRLVTLTGRVVLTKEKERHARRAAYGKSCHRDRSGSVAERAECMDVFRDCLHLRPSREANDMVHPSLNTNRHGSCP